MFVLYAKDFGDECGRFATGVEAEAAIPEIAKEIAAATGVDPDSIEFSVEEVLDEQDAEAVAELADARACLEEALQSIRRRQWDAKMTVMRAESRLDAIAREIERLQQEKAEIEARLPAMRTARDEALATLEKGERYMQARIAEAKEIEAAAADLRYGRPTEKAWRAKRDGRMIVAHKDLPGHAESLRIQATAYSESPAI
jgi:hypothetical protein